MRFRMFEEVPQHLSVITRTPKRSLGEKVARPFRWAWGKFGAISEWVDRHAMLCVAGAFGLMLFIFILVDLWYWLYYGQPSILFHR